MLPIAAMSESSQSKGMPWFKTGATYYQAQLGLLDKGHAIKELVVYWVLPGRMSVLHCTLHAVYVQSGVDPNCTQSDTYKTSQKSSNLTYIKKTLKIIFSYIYKHKNFL